MGRASFAGCDPYLVMRARGAHVELECLRAVRPGLSPGEKHFDADPFEVLRRLMPRVPPARAPSPDFIGGAVGYLGYELADLIEPIGLPVAGAGALPDLTMLFIDRLVAWDADAGGLAVHTLGFGHDACAARECAEASAEAFAADVASLRPSAASLRSHRRAAGALLRPFDTASHALAIDAVKQRIAAGDVYQVCLTDRLERSYDGDPWQLYRRLRDANPAPFAAYLELLEGAVVCSSPERFLRVASDRSVESRPIKGTAPRGADAAEDAENSEWLRHSEKDRAENLMIVDLVRNDLGRVCETGSIRVPELMAIEAYATVFQMVSTVSGRLRPECDAFDLVRASFPPGSMTGAPKIAAMRILNQLETARRGVYSGALGYFDARGGADLCVVIRTILVQEGRAHVHSGGGLVAESEPSSEIRELLDKARPLLSVLGDEP